MFVVIGALIIMGGFLFFINKDAATPLDQIVYMYNNPTSDQPEKGLTVYFFYGAECPHCHNVLPVVQNLSEKYPDVNFKILEVWHNQTNRDLSTKMLSELGQANTGVPLVIVDKMILLGDTDIPEQLEKIVINKTGRDNG